MTPRLHYAQVSVDLPAAIRHCAAVGLPHTALRDESAVVKTVLTEGLAQAPRPWGIIAQQSGTATLIGYSAGAPRGA